MNERHPLLAEIARLTEIEQRILDRFIHKQRVARDITSGPLTFGQRVADHVASLGGSWTFIGLALLAILGWLVVNRMMGIPFDPYPYILLNLVLSCLAALQAPIIMMSQNRQAAHDRMDAQHDYEVNTKAELEIVALHAKLDELREEKWIELMKLQEKQLELLSRLVRT